ncbi:helix-turn-helix domain-containing protein [Pelagibacterium xiamenense]|uniref:helix-turn-helix domain-containing protein n=1 Tax=Pelagibacterium xiamenense TaxID=2901140 RepID=UPI001E5059A3|nr:helix-turn-helix domain-containing protein [Pelagibacterium xiamenense]MCD7058317.1 helix-turn-helix domain-containing protein [Pelagibacterium xiamenense]
MDRKIGGKRYWDPRLSTVERVPNRLFVSHEQPGIMATAHWHAQVEINYVFAGTVDYQMQGHGVHLAPGDLCLFWGGLPHRVVDTSDDAFYIAIHLPLLHFFRLRLPEDIQQRLMLGGTLLTRQRDPSDDGNFARWSGYLRSENAARVEHAIDEVLLRIERIQFDSYCLLEAETEPHTPLEAPDRQSFHNIGRICSFVAANFRHDIDSNDIASSADIHPKYAMNVFKKSTGMTLNEYVSLLRLSYAQALLHQDDMSVLQVAMDSGFGSLSAFNASFRKLAGMSPSDFRRALRTRPGLGASLLAHDAGTTH